MRTNKRKDFDFPFFLKYFYYLFLSWWQIREEFEIQYIGKKKLGWWLYCSPFSGAAGWDSMISSFGAADASGSFDFLFSVWKIDHCFFFLNEYRVKSRFTFVFESPEATFDFVVDAGLAAEALNSKDALVFSRFSI